MRYGSDVSLTGLIFLLGTFRSHWCLSNSFDELLTSVLDGLFTVLYCTCHIYLMRGGGGVKVHVWSRKHFISLQRDQNKEIAGGFGVNSCGFLNITYFIVSGSNW